jgi:hypothetical protein
VRGLGRSAPVLDHFDVPMAQRFGAVIIAKASADGTATVTACVMAFSGSDSRCVLVILKSDGPGR